MSNFHKYTHLERLGSKFVTKHLVDKVYAKIVSDSGWSKGQIPRLLNTVYHDLILEEMWDILKKYKNPKIDFYYLNKLTAIKTKELLPDVF